MRRLLSSIALCALLQPAFAGTGTVPASPAVQPVALKAAFAPATAVDPQAKDGAATVVVASLKGEAGDAKPPQEDVRRPTAAVLLAAFLVMSGIALRRWGMGES